MVEYRWTRLEPLIDPTTMEVTSWIIGLLAEEGPCSAYRDASVNVTERKPLSEWTREEAVALAEKEARTRPVSSGPEEAEGRDWYEMLAEQIAAQAIAPIVGPNFAAEAPEPADLDTYPAAIVDEQGTVVNICVFVTGSDWKPQNGSQSVLSESESKGAFIGARWTGREFVAPVQPVASNPRTPASVEDRLVVLQAQLAALLAANRIEPTREFAKLRNV